MVLKLAQCWDDGIVDDIRLIEVLRRYGAKGSFNLNLGLHKEQRTGGWSDRYQKNILKLSLAEIEDVYAGFLVANHSLTHPHLTQIAPDAAEREIREGRDRLEQHFGYAVTGFAYPYGDTSPAIQEMVKATGHVYARTVQAVDNVFPPADPTAFHPSCHFLAEDFWDRFEKAQASGGVFYWWGHSYELVTDADWKAFEAKIARLSAAPNTQWVPLPDLFASVA